MLDIAIIAVSITAAGVIGAAFIKGAADIAKAILQLVDNREEREACLDMQDREHTYLNEQRRLSQQEVDEKVRVAKVPMMRVAISDFENEEELKENSPCKNRTSR